MYQTANDTAEKKAYLTNLHALKRVASPDEIAIASSRNEQSSAQFYLRGHLDRSNGNERNGNAPS